MNTGECSTCHGMMHTGNGSTFQDMMRHRPMPIPLQMSYANVYANVYAHASAHAYAHAYAHVYTHVHTHASTHVYTHVSAHVRSHVHTHVHTRVYAHVHRHVHTHAYAQISDKEHRRTSKMLLLFAYTLWKQYHQRLHKTRCPAVRGVPLACQSCIRRKIVLLPATF